MCGTAPPLVCLWTSGWVFFFDLDGLGSAHRWLGVWGVESLGRRVVIITVIRTETGVANMTAKGTVVGIVAPGLSPLRGFMFRMSKPRGLSTHLHRTQKRK